MRRNEHRTVFSAPAVGRTVPGPDWIQTFQTDAAGVPIALVARSPDGREEVRTFLRASTSEAVVRALGVQNA